MSGRRAPFAAMIALFALLVIVLLAGRCRAAESEAPELLRARVLRVHPHDPSAYTQGLLWHRGELYESTGRYGASRLRRVELESGTVLQEIALPDSAFGEGLARAGERLYQLTWRGGRGWVRDLATFEPRREFFYEGEGWGLCWDGATLWMSDGSDRLSRHDPEDFARISELTVTLEGRPVLRLNELECAEGWIYANVYGSDQIVRVDPLTGEVRAVIEAGDLLTPAERRQADVLNGIAYDPEREVFFLTGKYWPRLFEVRFEP